MKTRFFHRWAVAALVLCISAAWGQSPLSQDRRIDPALLAKATAGDAEAQYQLGGLYHFGQGVPRDDAQAFDWMMKAAQQGHSGAEFFIYVCYSEGWGVAKDRSQEMVWLRKAAAQGNAGAEFALAGLFHVGQGGVPQDDAQAFAWAMKAAKQNDVDAEAFVAVCYTGGLGVAQDDAQTIVWLRKAAEQGNAISQYARGWSYEDGDGGLRTNDVEAYFWLDLATLNETDESRLKDYVKKRDEVASHLSPTRLALAEQRVQDWLEDHPANQQ
jgi:TPR repeat protein